MLRNKVKRNPSKSYCAPVVKGSDGERKKTDQARHCQPAHCHITHHMRFYVASLRRCVRPSFAFLAMRHVIQWAKIFSHATAQRKSKAESTRATINWNFYWNKNGSFWICMATSGRLHSCPHNLQCIVTYPRLFYYANSQRAIKMSKQTSSSKNESPICTRLLRLVANGETLLLVKEISNSDVMKFYINFRKLLNQLQHFQHQRVTW